MINRKAILTAGVLIASFSFAAQSSASNVRFHIGTPYYGYSYYDIEPYQGRHPYFRYGFELPPYSGFGPYYGYPPPRSKLSCAQARYIVRSHGYLKVRVRECSGRVYSFSASQDGRRVVVRVNSRTGQIWNG